MIEAQGEDFSVHFIEPTTTEDAKLILSCKRCEWEIDLNKLDTLEDIWVELEHHGDVNHAGTKTN